MILLSNRSAILASVLRIVWVTLRQGVHDRSCSDLVKEEKGWKTMEPSGNFAHSMARAIDPLPSAGFIVKRRSGHLATTNLPRLLDFIAKRASYKVELELSQDAISLMLKRLRKHRLNLYQRRRLALKALERAGAEKAHSEPSETHSKLADAANVAAKSTQKEF